MGKNKLKKGECFVLVNDEKNRASRKDIKDEELYVLYCLEDGEYQELKIKDDEE